MDLADHDVMYPSRLRGLLYLEARLAIHVRVVTCDDVDSRGDGGVWCRCVMMCVRAACDPRGTRPRLCGRCAAKDLSVCDAGCAHAMVLLFNYVCEQHTASKTLDCMKKNCMCE